MSRSRTILALLATLILGPALPAAAAVSVRVDIASQTMRVETSAGESHRWAISTGRLGYRTPNGVYRPQRLERFWRSRRYGMAPMPHAIFFRGGYAIHGTSEVGRLGRPASHGCIRLHPAAAARLFALVQRHGAGATRISITGSRPDLDAPQVARRRLVRDAWEAPRPRRTAPRERLYAPRYVDEPIYYGAPAYWYYR